MSIKLFALAVAALLAVARAGSLFLCSSEEMFSCAMNPVVKVVVASGACIAFDAGQPFYIATGTTVDVFADSQCVSLSKLVSATTNAAPAAMTFAGQPGKFIFYRGKLGPFGDGMNLT
jgi:hypothetical protein